MLIKQNILYHSLPSYALMSLRCLSQGPGVQLLAINKARGVMICGHTRLVKATNKKAQFKIKLLRIPHVTTTPLSGHIWKLNPWISNEKSLLAKKSDQLLDS